MDSAKGILDLIVKIMLIVFLLSMSYSSVMYVISDRYEIIDKRVMFDKWTGTIKITKK
jgi:hypothetical protein